MDFRQVLMITFAVSLLLTVFGYGLRATLNDVLYLVQRPGLLVRSLLAMFVIVPVAAVLLVRAFDLEPTVEITLVALALSPVPPLLPRKAGSAGAYSAYPLALVTTMSLLSIVVVQLAVLILSQAFGRELVMSPATLARTVVQAVLAPLVVGMLVRWLMPHVADRVEKPLGILSGAMLTVAALVLVGANLSTIWALASADAVLAIVAFTVIGLVAGHVLAGPEPEHDSVLALASATRHPGIALTIASANFPLERFGGTILLYLLVSAVVGIPYVRWRKASTVATTASKTTASKTTRSESTA